MAKTVKTRPESFCFIDVESYSDVDVDYGAVNYFASAKAGIHCICYKIDDGDTRRIWLGGKIKPLPKELLAHKGYFVAHNWFFEWCAFRRFYPTTRLAEIEPWLCTAAIARRYHIAGSRAALDEVAIRCGAGSTKLHEGKRLIATYSYPRKDTGEFIPVPDTDKQAWLDYCAHDVELTAFVFKRLWPAYSQDKHELRVFRADKYQQARGVPIDLKGVKLLMQAGERLRTMAEQRAEAVAGRTPGGALILTSNSEFLSYLKARFGVELPDAQANTLTNLARKTDNPELREIIELRAVLMTRATDKAERLALMTSADGRYYNPSIYSAALTGRWMSWGANFFNFYKYTVPAEKWTTVAKQQAKEPTREGLASLQRGLVCAPKGRVLIITDWRQIENYLSLYYAGDITHRAILESGQSLYIAFGQRLFGRAITRNDKREYNLAKIAVLSLGYGAGASKFCQVANAAGVAISQDEAENVVKLWRTANVAIVNAWLGVERAFRSTLHSPYGRSAHYRQIKFYGRENTVYIELPNGYRIYYPNCAIDRATGELSWSADGITREKLYGGKIWENIIQATAAQILRRALVILEDAGVEVILHIHDEIIAECDRSKARSTARLIANVMRSAPEWAPDMRLEIEQKIARRWTK